MRRGPGRQAHQEGPDAGAGQALRQVERGRGDDGQRRHGRGGGGAAAVWCGCGCVVWVSCQGRGGLGRVSLDRWIDRSIDPRVLGGVLGQVAILAAG